MDTKHAFTPGPWSIKERSKLFAEDGKNCIGIIDLFSPRRNGDRNLIAAAPELLSALEEILEVYYNDFFMEMRSIIGGTDEYIRTKFQEIPAVMKAKEAIKKAIGE
jgi:hypothetical protein